MNIRPKLILCTEVWLLILAMGCGTIVSHQAPSRMLLQGEPRFYRGVTYDGKQITENQAFGLLIMCDVPFSFVADTFMIPFDAKSHYVVENR